LTRFHENNESFNSLIKSEAAAQTVSREEPFSRFQGGASLSKYGGIIKQFSEDLDVTVEKGVTDH
jgi:predicted nucleotidyltransferase component of viral defense system